MGDDLLELAISDPAAAIVESERHIDASADEETLSIAFQAKGIVLRDAGRLPEALDSLRAALRYAMPVSVARAADVRATYGVALFLSGRAGAALRELDRAASDAAGSLLATVLMRRAAVRGEMGQWAAAEADALQAVAGLSGEKGPVWEARTLNNLGVFQLALGKVTEAEQSFRAAEQLFNTVGLRDEALVAHSNQGAVCFTRGDLPGALEAYAQAPPKEVKNPWFRLGVVWDHYQAYVAAGLVNEALLAVESNLMSGDVPAWAKADLHLALASVRLASGDSRGAKEAARVARHKYRRQRREWFELRAHLVEVQARHMSGERRGLAGQARVLALRLDDERADEAPTALVLAGRLGTGAVRTSLWHAASKYSHRPSPMVRASAWLGAALERAEAGDRAGVLRAGGRGLDAIDEHRQMLGSTELRALATAHGRELTELTLRHAASDPRTLLRWSERSRATTLAEPPVRPKDGALPDLVALRDTGRRLGQARADGEPTGLLEADRARLERLVRAEHHRRAGRQESADVRFNIKMLVSDVGDGCLIELVDVSGTLHVLVVHDGNVRRRVAGSTDEALQLAALARSAVRRAGHGRPYHPGDLGSRLQEVLLGRAADQLPEGPVVISPTGRLHAVPWSMLPALTDRPFSIVPSAAQWQRARAVPKPRRRKVLLLSAPGLGNGGSEVPKLARRHQGAKVLRGKKATVEAALSGLDGASLAHVAAHGHFRQDSPMFSSLEMADGPLTVYELERLKRAPYRLILSACESGVLAPVGADELLGLASALFSMGTAGLVCSIAEVNDDATAALMLDLHEHLAIDPEGGLAAALLAARRAAQGDPTREATAAAFLALGI